MARRPPMFPKKQRHTVICLRLPSSGRGPWLFFGPLRGPMTHGLHWSHDVVFLLVTMVAIQSLGINHWPWPLDRSGPCSTCWQSLFGARITSDPGRNPTAQMSTEVICISISSPVLVEENRVPRALHRNNGFSKLISLSGEHNTRSPVPEEPPPSR